MKRLATLGVVILLLPLAFAAFSQPPQPVAEKASNTEADAQEIREWIKRYCATVTAGDFAAYRNFWTEDVVWLPPHGPALTGIEACMEHNRPYFEQYDSVEKMSVEEIEVGDRFTYVRVDYTYHGESKKEADPLDEDGKGIFILKRKPDGSWVSTHCVWNSNVPLPN